MKIGVLECDHLPAALSHHGDYPHMFKELLQEVEPPIEFKVYDAVAGDLPGDIRDCDAYLMTGSKHSAFDPLPWIVSLEDFIRDLYQAQKKLLGICFGHQLMARALGGEVSRSDKGWGLGIYSNEIFRQTPFMNSGLTEFSLIASHQDQITRLPEQTEVLAGSDFCPYYMLQTGEHFLSIQGHPEFSRAFITDLMEQRRARIPAGVINSASESLQHDHDDHIVAQWIMNFMKD